MDTSGLESFAQSLRTDLLNGVRQRLRYWGFQEDGTVEAEPEEVEGGYTFRGEVHDDPEVPKKWRALKNAVRRHGIDHVAEEAAYTWFNRLVAIRIMEKNGHLTGMLGYAGDTRRPAVLDRAYDGIINVLDEKGAEEVRQAILESDDDRAFRQLLVGVCHDNDLLNDVFGRLRDYTELLLPTGLLDREGPVDRLVTTDAISDEDYEQVELIGWLYQFYISEKKDEVYDSSGKFQPEDIPAATQIFTPRWIVRYMVENTIGKQWLEKYPDSPLRDDMEYLVENDNEDVEVRENGGAAEQMEVFDEEDDGDPGEPIFDDLSELELFDPAAGSGHILVVGFDLLMEMYRERGYTDQEAVEQILTENLKGLEIDRRAAQLARFALLMKAAQYDRRALGRDDLRPKVYAMPEPRDFSTSDLRAYLGDDIFDAHGSELKEALDSIAEYGKNVGSALKMEVSSEVSSALAERMKYWETEIARGSTTFDSQSLHREIKPYLKALYFLTNTYSSVATNPPYASGNQLNSDLRDYLKDEYEYYKDDLFATFMDVVPKRTTYGGRFALITPPSWMFLGSYEDLRNRYIDEFFIENLLHMSRGIFGSDFGSVSCTVKKDRPRGRGGSYFRIVRRTFQEFRSEDLHSLFERTLNNKDFKYKFESYTKGADIPKESDDEGERIYFSDVNQKLFKKVPESIFLYYVERHIIESFDLPSIGDITVSEGQTITGNNKKFLRNIWEVSKEKVGMEERWVLHPKGGKYRKWYGNVSFVIDWSDKAINHYREDNIARILPEYLWGRKGVCWSMVDSEVKKAFRVLRKNEIFNKASPTLFPTGDGNLNKILSLLNTKISTYYLKALNPTLNTNIKDIKKIPFREPPGYDTVDVAKGCTRISYNDWVSRETAWGFTVHPIVNQSAGTIEHAYDAWRQQATDDFLHLHANEEELNELFIDLYGLEDKLSPRVPFDDITILEDELDRDALEELDGERDDLSDHELRQRFLEDDPDDALFKVEVPIRQFLSYGVGVMLGRYRLGHDGLHIAHPDPSDDELAPYDVPVPLSGPETNGTEQFEIDDDAIVPIMGRDSPFSDDAVYRMRDIVRLIWGEETLTENLNFINHALSVGRSRGLVNDYEKTMEEWLVGDFWDWHKSLYSVPYYGKKPIYWLFQSPEGHFQVLVYMHRMDKFTPQRIRQDYLQRYQQYLRREITELEQEGEETLSKEEVDRLDTLRAAAEDCRAYDTILQEVAEQQIEIDLDDGVQNNYPKFGDAVADL